MARTRAKLTDKEEKILLQAQLMGLGKENMVKIANRLVAIEREARHRSEIENIMQGIEYETLAPVKGNAGSGWTIRYDGYSFACRKMQIKGRNWNHSWQINVTKPGTRLKEKQIENISLYTSENYKKAMLPERSDELLALAKKVKQGNWV